MSGGLYGKAALIVNGTDAVGFAISRRLGLAGAKVMITDSDQTRLQQKVGELDEAGIMASGAVVDVFNRDQREKLLAEAGNKLKSLDCVVINPGSNEVIGDIFNNTKMDFDKVFNQYLTIPFHLACTSCQYLEKSKNGVVITVSSMAGFTSFVDLGLFSTVQTGLLGMTGALAQDMAKHTVRVNSVVLGMFKDDNSRAIWNSKDEKVRESLESLIPARRLGQAKDCAGLVEFLMSDRAKYITGENLPITGGISVRSMKRLNLQPLPQISAVEYAARRWRLMSSLKRQHPEPVVLLSGFNKTFSAPDVPHPFRQCSYFRYLTGCLEPNSSLVLTPKESVLFLHWKSDSEKLWDGETMSPEGWRSVADVNQVLPITELPSYLISALTASASLAVDTRPNLSSEASILCSKFSGKRLSLLPEIDRLRWIKSDVEAEYMRTAAFIGSQALNAVLETQKSVDRENAIVGRLEYEMRRRGAQSQAYPPVVAAGARANTIHYIDSNQCINDEDCVLVDAGADYHGYVSDISRCFPASGTFTPAQRELYEALFEIQNDCIEYAANIRPLRLNDLYFHMFGSMAAVLKSIFFFKKGLSDQEVITICSKLCEHHVSHYLGMDVHDTCSVARTIEIPPGVVITVEPGIYVTDRVPEVRDEFVGIGFRIEDDVLVTESGIEVLSRNAVKERTSVEQLMNW